MSINIHDIISKKWGYEIVVVNNDFYCGKKLHVLPLKWCSVHYHKNKKETFYVISGELKLQYSTILDFEYWNSNNEHITTLILKSGESFTIDTMIAHRFTSNTSLFCEFIEFSTHHDDADSYRIINSI
jgi:mannose-6-phosphate isomerase-like protein (cupin superfamily)